MAIVGYGKGSYGLTEPYGSVDPMGLRILNAISNANYDIEVFFSEELYSTPELLLTSSYTVTALIGAPTSILSVTAGQLGPIENQPFSIRIQTSGLTRGGAYVVNVIAPIQGISGVVSAGNSYSFYSYGRGSTFTVTPSDQNTLILEFDPEILDPYVDSGVEDISNYVVSTEFPIPLILNSAEYIDSNHVELTVTQQTQTNYDLVVGVADTATFQGSDITTSTLDYNFRGTGYYEEQDTHISLRSIIGEDYILSVLPSEINAAKNYQCFINIDFTSLVTLPTLSEIPPVIIEFSDGNCCGTLTFSILDSVGVININWGSASVSIFKDWFLYGSLEILKNQLSGHYGFLMDGEPTFSLLSANFTKSPEYLTDPGVAVVLTANYDIQNLNIGDISFEYSETIYNLGWNFIHNAATAFVGSSLGTSDTFFTEKGPLVKDWGSSTPAGPEDVLVFVDGGRVPVREVNPYTGKITLSTPLPLSAPGTFTVEVTYAWFSNPTFPLSKLNYEGLVLNKWDYDQVEHNDPDSNTGLGALDLMRFPYSIVLGPHTPKQPISIAHRFLGFEKEYSSVLNSPLSLKLNQNPHASRAPYLEKSSEPESFFYNGDELPEVQGWSFIGDNSNTVVTEGVLTLVDDKTAPVDLNGENVLLYYAEVNDSLPGVFLSSQRFQLISTNSFFSGVCFGYTNQRTLALIGLLSYNGLSHLGLLRNTLTPNDINSWEILAKKEIRILNQKTFRIQKSLNFSKLEIGSRFQIIQGNQSSVQTISAIDETDRNFTVFTIEGMFPQSPITWGDRDVSAYFEIDFISKPISVLFRAQPEENIYQIDLSGTLSGVIYSDIFTSSPISREHLTLVLPDSEKSIFFWGSCSRVESNISKWSQVQATYAPEPKVYYVDNDIVSSEMDEIPTEDLNSKWDRIGSLGYAQPNQISSGLLNLFKVANYGDDTRFIYGFKRVEPFLKPTTYSDFELSFRVDASSSFKGQPVFKINDTIKEVVLGCISYVEYGSGSIPFRKLVSTPQISIVPEIPLSSQNIDQSGVSNLTLTQTDQYLDLSKSSILSGGVITTELDLSPPDFALASRRFIMRAAIISHDISGASNRLPVFVGFGSGLSISSNVRTVYLQWKYQTTPTNQAFVCLVDGAGTEISEVAFDWELGSFYTYKLNTDPIGDTVELWVNDNLIITEDYSNFSLGGTDNLLELGAETTNTAATLRVLDLGLTTGYLSGLHKTFGILSGSNPEDIDSWVLPRTDNFIKTNNSVEGTAIEDMDWSVLSELRIHRDPEWGVSVFRPDLSAPPYFDGEFFNEITEPSAAWINVEYGNLPSSTQSFGSISWGALQGGDWLDSQWDYVRYRIYANKEDTNIIPRNMVLNQYNIVSSGDLSTSNKPLEVEFITTNSLLVELDSLDLRAARVFYVYDEGIILNSSEFSFDYDKQEITFNSPRSSEKKTVSVIFTPDTNHLTGSLLSTYLVQESSQTILNDSTPYIPWNKLRGILREITVSSILNDPDSLLNTPDFILNDYLRKVEFTDDSEWELDCAEFFALANNGESGLLTSICDDNTLDGGLLSVEFVDDTFFEDNFTIPNNYGSVLPLTPFILSGGEGVYSLFGPDSVDVFYPNYAPGYNEDPNVGPTNLTISIELEDLVSGVTVVYLFV